MTVTTGQRAGGRDSRRRILDAMGIQLWERRGRQEPAGDREPLAEVDDCVRCAAVTRQTPRLAFAGDPAARLMLVFGFPPLPVGDAALTFPLSGEPLALLQRMLAAIGLSIEQVLCTTLLKCARSPEESGQLDDVIHCLPFLERQLADSRVEQVFVMGEQAARHLLTASGQIHGDEPFDTLRRQCFQLENRAVHVSYSPARLLGDAGLKKPAWVDLQALQQRLNGQV